MNNYDLYVQTFFKERYRQGLKLGKILELEEILDACQIESGIQINYLNPSTKAILEKWYGQINQLHFIQDYLVENLEELIFHTPTNLEVISDNTRKIEDLIDKYDSSDYMTLCQTMALKHNADWNEKNSFICFMAPLFGHTFRVSLIHPAILGASLSPKLFLRKICPKSRPLEDYLNHDSNFCRNFFEKIVKEKSNILICGSTGSGKTSFLSSLAELIPKEEHVVCIEDERELGRTGVNNTFLKSNESIVGKRATDYCAYALRMRPDRILLGEMRSLEAIPFILILNSGHGGGMATLHANNAVDALERVALLFQLYSNNQNLGHSALMNMICKNINYVFYLQNKKVHQGIRLIGFDGKNPIYELLAPTEYS